MNQGTVTVDWDHANYAMVITYPGGKTESAFNKKDALAKIKRWSQHQSEIVSSVTGQPTIGTARIEWHNNTNG